MTCPLLFEHLGFRSYNRELSKKKRSYPSDIHHGAGMAFIGHRSSLNVAIWLGGSGCFLKGCLLTFYSPIPWDRTPSRTTWTRQTLAMNFWFSTLVAPPIQSAKLAISYLLLCTIQQQYVGVSWRTAARVWLLSVQRASNGPLRISDNILQVVQSKGK